MWFIGVEVEQETNAPPPKRNPGSAPALCWLNRYTLEFKCNFKKMTIVIPVDNKLFTVPYMFQ